MTVRRNLGYGLRVRGPRKPRCDAAVERVARILEIDHLLDRKPGAALRRPAPARGARPRHGAPARHLPDGRAAVEPRRQAARHHARGAAPLSSRSRTPPPIYVTHDQLEAMTMSDMIAVMHGGIVQQFGTPAEVYGRPANLFVAGFIGSPPMNFITGHASRRRCAHVQLSGPHAAASGCCAASPGRASSWVFGRRTLRWSARASLRPCAGASGWWTARVREASRGHLRRAAPPDRASAGGNQHKCRRSGRRAARSAAGASVRCRQRRRSAFVMQNQGRVQRRRRLSASGAKPESAFLRDFFRGQNNSGRPDRSS